MPAAPDLMLSTQKLVVIAMEKGQYKLAAMLLLKLTCLSFVEFESAADMKVAVDKLDSSEFKGSNVRCIADVRAAPNH